MSNPLFDFNFLIELMNYQHREVYARITLLTQNELPLQQIEGRVTGGSINVDGNSALRRTCNLSLILKDQSEINSFYWAFKQKFKLEIGLSNAIDKKYPEIIWFKQGIFIIASHDMSQSVNNYTITINGKDKMCLLNGDLSGSLFSTVDFGAMEYHDLDTNTVTKTQMPLKDIIYEAVHSYGNESVENIIINDLDDFGLELLEYRNEKPLFGLCDKDKKVSSMILDENHPVWIGEEQTTIGNKKIIYVNNSSLVTDPNAQPTKVKISENDTDVYTVLKFEYGDLAGYRTTDLVYAGELIGNVGESLTSILDKIRNMLGEFEYFYNVDGKFVFQKKKKYISMPWNSSGQDSTNELQLYLDDSLPIIKLLDNKLITSFANRPNLANVRNDFCVWGTYRSVSGANIPIHMRYAIDEKPVEYMPIRPMKQEKEIDGKAQIIFQDKNYFGTIGKSGAEDGEITSYYAAESLTSDKWDWRELIYQMALDYRKCQKDSDFLYNLASKNPQYPTGRTGYEQYYTDLEGFWRMLYDPSPEPEFIEVDNSSINKDNLNKVYIANPHRKLTPDEYNNKTFKPEELFVLQNIKIDGKESDIKTFYPFIGSSACHLDEGYTYYYLKGSSYQPTKESKILNSIDMQQIYLDEAGKRSVVDERYENFTGDLWIKDSTKQSINDLSDIHKTAYNISSSENRFPNAYVIWSIKDNYGTLSEEEETAYEITYLLEESSYNSKTYWHKNVHEDPGKLTFWFDFLSAEGSDIFKYSVKEIGPRTKFINDSAVKVIQYDEIPEVVFVSKLSEEVPSGYTKIQLPSGYEGLFSISTKGKSAKERIDELLYTHSYSIESTAINTIPIYYLEPNTRILIRDERSNIDGEYLVSKITIPLTYNGTMNLTATKINPNLVV